MPTRHQQEIKRPEIVSIARFLILTLGSIQNIKANHKGEQCLEET